MISSSSSFTSRYKGMVGRLTPASGMAGSLLSVILSGAIPGRGQSLLPADVSLPARGGMYAIETKPASHELVLLHATEIQSNSHAASNLARSIVYSGPHASVELEGLNAGTHLHGAALSLLVRLSDDSPELMRGRLTLIRLRQTGDRRLVSSYSQNIFGGQRKREYDVVAVTKADIPDTNWLTLTPLHPLSPGEYGLILMPKDPALFPSEVYDFDVDIEEAKPSAK